MQTMKHFTYIFLLALAVLVAGCSDNEFEFSENYDIPWKISTITAVSPLSAVPGVAITIQGDRYGNLHHCVAICNQHYNYCPQFPNIGRA